MLTLDFYNRTKTRISKKIFEKLLTSSYKVLCKDLRIKPNQHFFLELTLVGDSVMKRFNKIYHNKDRSTDVISLSYFNKKMKDTLVGEIFISLPYARRQAKKIRQTLTEELQFLFIHGLLHSFGYDHKKPKEEAHMLKLTYTILGRV